MLRSIEQPFPFLFSSNHYLFFVYLCLVMIVSIALKVILTLNMMLSIVMSEIDCAACSASNDAKKDA